MNKWYYKLVSEEYRTYIQQTIIQRDNKVNNDNPNANKLGGYYAYQPSKKDEIIWLPLLPLYTVYTKINDTFFKLSIIKNTNCQLIYQWYFYAKDETFKLLKNSGQDNICFKTCFSNYNWSENRSPLWYLGLSHKDNIQYLQETIIQKHPNFFNQYSQTIKAFNTEKTLKNSLTCVKYQLQTVMEMEETPIRKGVMLNKSEKYLSPQETQALIVEYNTIKNELKNAKKTITQLKNKITRLTNLTDQDIDSSQDKILHTTINDLIEKWKLGSTLLVDTKIYSILAFERPCNNCRNYLISK
ncbi:8437_t:CDS:2, partial [Gigaspora rosea]